MTVRVALVLGLALFWSNGAAAQQSDYYYSDGWYDQCFAVAERVATGRQTGDDYAIDRGCTGYIVGVAHSALVLLAGLLKPCPSEMSNIKEIYNKSLKIIQDFSPIERQDVPTAMAVHKAVAEQCGVAPLQSTN